MSKSYKDVLMCSIIAKNNLTSVIKEIDYCITRKNIKNDDSPEFKFRAVVSKTNIKSLVCLYCGNFIEIKNKLINPERNSAIYCNNLEHHKNSNNKQNKIRIIQLLSLPHKYNYSTNMLSLRLHKALLLIIINKYQKLEPFYNLILEWLTKKCKFTNLDRSYKVLNGETFLIYKRKQEEIYKRLLK
jgi:hypothetical protein